MLVAPFLPVLLASLSAASPISLQQVFQADSIAAPAAPAQAPTDLVDAIVADAARAGADIHAMGMTLDDDHRARPLLEAARVVPGTANAPAPGGWVWKSCGDADDAVEVTSIKVSPDPPKPGQNLTVVASGIVKKEIKAGTYADVVVKLGLIRLLTRRFDVCEEAKENDAELQCPVQSGEYTITQTVELPREIPPAKFNVHVNGATQDEEPLLCLDLSIDFMHHR